MGPALTPDGLKAVICRRLGKLPDEVGRQNYADLMKCWQYITLMDRADKDAREG